uniref:Uncharacterized protein n=1 Tax=Caenorhabditis japonica TaxID=281687 RepID=A0A8R1HQU2_CAEJA
MSENKTMSPPMLPPANSLTSTTSTSQEDFFKNNPEIIVKPENYGFTFAEYPPIVDSSPNCNKAGNVINLNFDESEKKKKDCLPHSSTFISADYPTPFIPYYFPNQSFSNTFNNYPMSFAYPIPFDTNSTQISQENC